MPRTKTTTKTGQKPAPFLVTEVYIKLLEGVFTYHLITASQLCRLYYSPKSITLVKTRAKHLVDHGYLLALHVPTTRGNSPHIYTLARKGLNLLKDNGFAVNEYFRPSQEVDKEKNYLFLAHTIETNDFLICASKLPLFAPAYSLDSLLHERVLKRTPFSVTVSRESKTETIAIIPDGFITFTNTDGKTFPIWLELDRGKVDQKQYKRKIRGILTFLASGVYEKHFATKHVTIAFAVTAGENRLTQLRTWTQAELTAFPGGKQYEEVFLFTCVPPHNEVYPDPRTLFFTPVWSLPYSNEKTSLLVE